MKNNKLKKNMSLISPKPNWVDNSRLHNIIIFLFAVILYANTIVNDYTQDDAIVITDNMFTKKGFSGISGLLTNDTFYGFFKKEGKAKLVSGGRYRPLTPITFAIEYQFFGHNPNVSHFINIILFGLLGIVLYKFLLLVFFDIKNESIKYLVPFFATIIFVAHPIHTEAVANIKGRDEILTLLFSLLAVIYSIKWLKAKQFKLQIYVFILFIMALFSKENAITFLAIVPLIFYIFFNEDIKTFFKVILPFLVATIVFLVVRTMVLGLDFGSSPMELMNNPFLKIDGNRFVPFAFGEKMATIIFTLGKYIQLLIFPHPLTNDYYPRQIVMMSFGNWKVILSLILHIAMIYFALKNLKKYKILSFGILFYLITLSIVSNIVFPVGTNMSERFVFMPSVGFSLVFGYLLYVIYEKYRTLSFVIAIIVLLLFSVKTISRNMVWVNDFTLFTTDVNISSNSAKALNAAGGSLVDAAFDEKNIKKKIKRLLQAREYLYKALKIHPNYKNALLILGNSNYFLENYDEAIYAYENVLKLDPNYQEGIRNLGITYRDAGKYYGEKKNNIKKALTYLEKAYKMKPDDYETVRLYGVALAISGNNLKAIELFAKGIQLKPSDAGAFVNLGNVYYNSGDKLNGKMYHDRARELNPKVFEK